MKTLALLLLSLPVLSAPRDVQFSSLGPWPLCEIFPVFCVAPGSETYMVEAMASGDDVIGFDFTLTYAQAGEVKTMAGHFDRDDASTGYSNSGPLTLGKIEFINLDVSETK